MGVLVVAIAVLLVYLAWSIIQPLIVAVVLATTLWPWVSRFARRRVGRWRLPRMAAAALIYLATFALAGAVVWITVAALVPHLEQLIATFPRETAFLREYLEAFRSGNLAEGARQVAEDVAGQASGEAPDSTAGGGDVNASRLAVGLLGGVLNTGLVLVFTFFLLVEGDRVASWVLTAVPRERRSNIRALLVDIRDRASRWVLAQALYALLSGLIVGGGTALLQLPSPWLYGIAAALLAIIPGIGPAVALVPAFFVALELSTWQPAAVAIFAGALYLVDSTTIATKVYGEMMELSMFVVFLALLIGAVLFGLWGAVIATPVAAGVQMTLRRQVGQATK